MTSKLAIPILLLGCMAGPALSQTPPSRSTMLLHGNYCGPGNNAPLAPIDALDAACARHDACTPDGAPASRACNLRLQRETASIARDPRQPDDVKTMAGFVSAGASLMPSSVGDADEIAVNPARFDPRLSRRAPGGAGHVRSVAYE